MKILLILSLSFEICFSQMVIEEQGNIDCDSIYHKDSDQLKFEVKRVYITEESVDRNDIAYNQIIYFDSKLNTWLYSIELPNEWYPDGTLKRYLSKTDSIYSYQHFNKKGKLKGEEYFYVNFQNKPFYNFYGDWWKCRRKNIIPYPEYFSQDFFNW